MRQQYRVRWEIDLEAASALDAARLALALQHDPRSVATVFDVVDETGRSATFDLADRAEVSPSSGNAPARACVGTIEESLRADGN